MASFYPCVKNHASGYTFYISLVSQADTKIMQASPTLAAGDFKIAIDDGAPANLGTLPVVDADYTKRVKVVLSQAETNGDNLTIICSDAAGAQWCDLTINIQTVPYRFDNLDAAISSRMATYTQPTGFLAATFPTGTVANTTNITAATGVTASTVSDKTGYALTSAEHTSIADATLNRDMSAVTDTSTRSPLKALRKLMNRIVNSGTTLTVYKEDDTTASFTQTVTESASRNPIQELNTD